METVCSLCQIIMQVNYCFFSMEKVVWIWTDVRDRSFSINHICSYPNYCISYYWPFAVCDLCVWSDIFLISVKVEMVQGILVNCDIKLSVLKLLLPIFAVSHLSILYCS